MPRLTPTAALCLLACFASATATQAWDEGPPPTAKTPAAGAAAAQRAQPAQIRTQAQAAPAAAAAPAAPAGQPMVSQDPKAAPAGTYKLDKNHASVIARVGHGGGFSYSTVRFGVNDGSLVWDPANVAASKLRVTVDMTPYYAPITYLMDPKEAAFLGTAQFPSATFISSAVRVTGPTTGVITGTLNFRGQIRLVTIAATLVGAGKTARGAPTVGFTGVMKFKRSDFGSTFALSAVSDEIEVVLDAEFGMPAPTAPAA